jgi:hypothetical protein
LEIYRKNNNHFALFLSRRDCVEISRLCHLQDLTNGCGEIQIAALPKK